MRILFVTSGLATGGAEMMLYKLLKAAPPQHLEPVVLSLGPRGAPADLIRGLGISVVELDLPRLPAMLQAVQRVSGLMSSFRPQLVCGWMVHGNLAAWLLARTARVPLVWNVRQTLNLEGEKPLTRWLIRAGVQRSHVARRIIYVSQQAREQYRALGYDDARACVLPNGFETEVFRRDEVARARMRLELGAKDTTCVIGHLARFHPQKDQPGLVRAAREVVAAGADVLFALAGAELDDKNARLTEAVREAGLAERFRLLGATGRPQDLLSACDLFCLPSAWGEGFPNAVGEAMCCELPCIVTRVGDAPELVGATGLAVPAGDMAALAAALLRLIHLKTTERRELGKQARNRIQELYSLPSVAARYCDVFSAALTADARPR